MLGLGAEIMDLSNLLATRLMIGLSWFRLCILWMGGLFKVFTGVESMLEGNEIGLHRVATAPVHRLIASSWMSL